jgi:subtilisin family serine protease
MLVRAAAMAAPREVLAPRDEERLVREIAERGRAVAVVLLKDDAREGETAPGTAVRRGVVALRARAFAATLDPAHAWVRRPYLGVSGAVVEVDERGLEALARHPEVAALVPDRRIWPFLMESVPLVRADRLQERGLTGAGVGIAILDSGINRAHRDLAPALLGAGFHALDQGRDVGEGGIDDDTGHGTSVAAVAASRGVVGKVGVAPGARVFVARVLRPAGGWISDWSLAIDYVTAHRDDFEVPIRVINLSLGTTELDAGCPCDAAMQPFAAAVAAARAAGLVVIAASGNQGVTGALPYPACFSAVLAVGAIYDATLGRSPVRGTYAGFFGGEYAECADDAALRGLACFTNRNACMRLLAPGGAITAAAVGGDDVLDTFWGTSQAAPHAAGVAAQLLGAYPQLTPGQVEQALLTSWTPRVLDPAQPGVTYPVLDALGAEAAVRCGVECAAPRDCMVGDCDGQGRCAQSPLPAGSPCGVPACQGGLLNVGACDGQGRCGAGETVSCGGFACDDVGSGCLASCRGAADCAGGATCVKGVCRGGSLCTGERCNVGCSCHVGARPAGPPSAGGWWLLGGFAIFCRSRGRRRR